MSAVNGAMIRFEGSPYAGHLYTLNEGDDPSDLEEAIESANGRFPALAFELWMCDGSGSYTSPEMETEE